MKYFLLLVVQYGIFYGISGIIMKEITILTFLVMFVIICVVFNGIFLMVFRKAGEFQYLVTIVKGKFRKRKE